MANSVYTAVMTYSRAAGSGGFPFWLTTNLRTLKIKSILLDVSVLWFAGGVSTVHNSTNYPVEQEFNLTVGWNVGGGTFNAFAKPFIIPAMAGLLVEDTGNYFKLVQSGQYLFNCFFVSERLDFSFNATNYTAADLMRYNINLVIEIEENINYI